MGLKKNSLFGNEVVQAQDSIEHFSAKIAAGKRAQKSQDFMICARIESLILEKGMEDALERAFAFVKAGADAIMIHSRKKDPAEIFAFADRFRRADKVTPLVVVPTSFHTVTEEEFKSRGINVVIYANQLTRAGFPAMRNAAKTILDNKGNAAAIAAGYHLATGKIPVVFIVGWRGEPGVHDEPQHIYQGRTIWCIDGDGAALMHLGAMAVIGTSGPCVWIR